MKKKYSMVGRKAAHSNRPWFFCLMLVMSGINAMSCAKIAADSEPIVPDENADDGGPPSSAQNDGDLIHEVRTDAFFTQDVGGGFADASAETEADGKSSNGDSQTKSETSASEPSFLDPKLYKDLVHISKSMPFGVIARYDVPNPISGAVWGKHDGPMIQTYEKFDPKNKKKRYPTLVRYNVLNDVRHISVTSNHTLVPSQDVASNAMWNGFYGPCGFTDLPFSSLTLISYTTVKLPFKGAVLGYDDTLSKVISSAYVNGYFAGVSYDKSESAADGRLLYTGLSSLSSTPSDKSDNGLYGVDICEGSLTPKKTCGEAIKLIGWTGASGPIDVDTSGNVFVAAYNTAETLAEYYSLTPSEAKSQKTLPAARELFHVPAAGTMSFTVVSPKAKEPGFVLGKDFDSFSDGTIASVHAQAYTIASGVPTLTGQLLENVFEAGAGVTDITVLHDKSGDLWLALSKSDSGSFLKLDRLP